MGLEGAGSLHYIGAGTSPALRTPILVIPDPKAYTMKFASLAVICLTAFVSQAHASSSDAWAAFDKTVLNSCTKASGLKGATPVGTAAQFDDRVGYTAILLQGQYPQKHMKGKQGTELCLYSNKTKTAYVTEWDSIRPSSKSQ